jgi:hypothetical protein
MTISDFRYLKELCQPAPSAACRVFDQLSAEGPLERGGQETGLLRYRLRIREVTKRF